MITTRAPRKISDRDPGLWLAEIDHVIRAGQWERSLSRVARAAPAGEPKSDSPGLVWLIASVRSYLEHNNHHQVSPERGDTVIGSALLSAAAEITRNHPSRNPP